MEFLYLYGAVMNFVFLGDQDLRFFQHTVRWPRIVYTSEKKYKKRSNKMNQYYFVTT